MFKASENLTDPIDMKTLVIVEYDSRGWYVDIEKYVEHGFTLWQVHWMCKWKDM